MKLFTTPNSPYGRIVRVMIEETGLSGRVETEFVTVRDAKSALLAYNPTGKVPSLLTDSGEVLSETRIIIAYLDSLHDGEKLMSAQDDLKGRALEGKLLGCLDGASVWMREYKRPAEHQYPWLIVVEHARASRCLDAFEKEPDLTVDQVRLPQIALGCTLGFMDVFLDPLDWRDGRPKLSDWYDGFATRDSMQATKPQPPKKSAATRYA